MTRPVFRRIPERPFSPVPVRRCHSSEDGAGIRDGQQLSPYRRARYGAPAVLRAEKRNVPFLPVAVPTRARRARWPSRCRPVPRGGDRSDPAVPVRVTAPSHVRGVYRCALPVLPQRIRTSCRRPAMDGGMILRPPPCAVRRAPSAVSLFTRIGFCRPQNPTNSAGRAPAGIIQRPRILVKARRRAGAGTRRTRKNRSKGY